MVGVREGRYYDKHGLEIHEGDTVRFDSGKIRKVYRTENDELGIDATNPEWVASGKAAECEYGIYPFTDMDMAMLEKKF